jgi:hypothetical protein
VDREADLAEDNQTNSNENGKILPGSLIKTICIHSARGNYSNPHVRQAEMILRFCRPTW